MTKTHLLVIIDIPDGKKTDQLQFHVGDLNYVK